MGKHFPNRCRSSTDHWVLHTSPVYNLLFHGLGDPTLQQLNFHRVEQRSTTHLDLTCDAAQHAHQCLVQRLVGLRLKLCCPNRPSNRCLVANHRLVPLHIAGSLTLCNE